MNDLSKPNVDPRVAAGFGHEWSTYRQGLDFSFEDRAAIFDCYFHIFPWDALPANSVGMDIGCGSGRWSVMVAPRVGHLHLLDVNADALDVARQNLSGATNVSFHLASVGDIPLPSRSLDFAFSLGVLHHVPDTQGAINAAVDKLKPGAPFLIYLYYALDNRPAWYRALWRMSELLRAPVSQMPPAVRLAISKAIAVVVYWPLARFAALVERLGFSPLPLPLESYRHRSFYVMKTDAYDRFCTALEQRFTRAQIEQMLTMAGLTNIRFSERVPFWCAVGVRQ